MMTWPHLSRDAEIQGNQNIFLHEKERCSYSEGRCPRKKEAKINLDWVSPGEEKGRNALTKRE